MDFRRKAIEMKQRGESAEKISEKLGLKITEEMIQKWSKEDQIESSKRIIFKLDSKQKKENNKEKRKKILLELKNKINEILKIVPDDIDMQTKLMYAEIGLKNFYKAREIGYSLLDKKESIEILNGVAITEEVLKNYDTAININKKIIEISENNEYYQKRIQRLEEKKQNTYKNETKSEKDILYREISSLEKNLLNLMDKKKQKYVMAGEHPNLAKISEEAYTETYRKIEVIAKEIIEKYPEEIVAKQRLLKALVILGENEEAKNVAENILEENSRDKVVLWYLSKIERSTGNLYKEKEYLDEIIKNSPEGAQVKVLQRLVEVENLINKKEEKEEIEKLIQEGNTEEARKQWLSEIQKEIVQGEITQQDIEEKIQEAKKYPNFTNSVIELLDLKEYMTGDLKQQEEDLEEYVDTEFSMTPQEYNDVLNEISRVRGKIEEEKNLEKLMKKKENHEKFEASNEQRQFSKTIIEKLNTASISKKDLPSIVKKLETFPDAARAIFLITKLYEIIDSREVAYENLIKYTTIMNLNSKDKNRIALLQQKLMEKDRKSGAIHKIKGIYDKQKVQSKYTKEINKQEIIQRLKNHQSVQQIFETYKEKGISLKSIARIKTFLARKDEDYAKEDAKIQRYARNLLEKGYNMRDVYAIMEYDVSMPTLQKLEKDIKELEEEQK